MRTIRTGLAVCAVLLSSHAHAEGMPGTLLRLKPNSSLRIETASLQRVEGRFLRTSGDTLVMTSGGAETSAPLSDLHAVWQRGKSTKTGAIVGGVIGCLGLLLLDASGPALSQDQSGGGDEGDPVAAFFIGAAGGALVGARIGTAILKWHHRYP